MKNWKIFAFAFSIVTLLAIFSTTAFAYVTRYETEPNDSPDTADRTYNDYNNYGAISSTSDTDCWAVTFSQSGMANFYLGSIPEGCNYDLQLHDGLHGGSYVLRESKHTGNTSELIRYYARTVETYTLRIISASGASSSNYLFRAKVYPFTAERIYTIDNDDGNKNASVGFSQLLNTTNSYGGNARIQACDGSNNYYRYYFPTYTASSPVCVYLEVFLDYTRFNDPQALYSINNYLEVSKVNAGTYNQDTAPRGWSGIGLPYTTIHSADGTYSSCYVQVEASGAGSGKYCGADAVSCRIGY